MDRLNLKPFHFFYFLTALFTFAVGMAVAGLCYSRSEHAKLPEEIQVTEAARMPEEIQITFEGARLVENAYVKGTAVARFRVVNGLREPLYYLGYSQDDHCAYRYRVKGKIVKQLPMCTCGTGLMERTVPAGEAQILVLELPKQAQGEFEAEFNFAVGAERRQETVRVKSVTSFRQ